jgi:hypothetical protein
MGSDKSPNNKRKEQEPCNQGGGVQASAGASADNSAATVEASQVAGSVKRTKVILTNGVAPVQLSAGEVARAAPIVDPEAIAQAQRVEILQSRDINKIVVMLHKLAHQQQYLRLNCSCLKYLVNNTCFGNLTNANYRLFQELVHFLVAHNLQGNDLTAEEIKILPVNPSIFRTAAQNEEAVAREGTMELVSKAVACRIFQIKTKFLVEHLGEQIAGEVGQYELKEATPDFCQLVRFQNFMNAARMICF